MDNLRENHKEFIENREIILKSQQWLKREKHNVSTEKVHKIVLTGNNDKWI